MAKPALVCAALAVAAAFTLPAQNFPLQFKTIPAQDVMNFAGGSGVFGSLSSSKPHELNREPKAISRHPLYAECRLSSGGETLLVRLDESQGDGKGYDQILVDLNHNGDLTDDGAATRANTTPERGGMTTAVFGPIEAPADKSLAGGRPVFYAQTTFYPRSFSSARVSVPAGYLRLKAGWYLETTVNVDGVKRKVGVYDANSNLRLGDVPKALIQRPSGIDSAWGFDQGDVWLVDANGSGSFEQDVFTSEGVPFGPLLYLGAKPCKVTLAADCQSLGVEPWSGPLAEVAVGPRAEHVHSLTLAWERQGGQWQLLRPALVAGKIQVPPGNYRLYNCNLLGKTASGEQTAVTATERTTRMPFSFGAEKANKLQCGAPLDVKVAATKTRGGSSPMVLLEESSSAGRVAALRISAQLVGAEGEVYSAYYAGDKLKSQPPKPTFTITDTEGKEVAHGNLEYG